MERDFISREAYEMSKRLLRILYKISKELRDSDIDTEEILDTIQYDKSDLVHIWDDLEGLETSGTVDEDSLDILKALLVYILMRDSALEKDEIYALVFCGGKKIVWH